MKSQIDIAEDGTVFIAGVDGEKADKALRLIEQMTWCRVSEILPR